MYLYRTGGGTDSPLSVERLTSNLEVQTIGIGYRYLASVQDDDLRRRFSHSFGVVNAGSIVVAGNPTPMPNLWGPPSPPAHAGMNLPAPDFPAVLPPLFGDLANQALVGSGSQPVSPTSVPIIAQYYCAPLTTL